MTHLEAWIYPMVVCWLAVGAMMVMVFWTWRRDRNHDCADYAITGCLTCGREQAKHRGPCLDQNFGRICSICYMKVNV